MLHWAAKGLRFRVQQIRCVFDDNKGILYLSSPLKHM